MESVKNRYTSKQENIKFITITTKWVSAPAKPNLYYKVRLSGVYIIFFLILLYQKLISNEPDIEYITMKRPRVESSCKLTLYVQSWACRGICLFSPSYSAQRIDHAYTSESPHWGGSNEHPKAKEEKYSHLIDVICGVICHSITWKLRMWICIKCQDSHKLPAASTQRRRKFSSNSCYFIALHVMYIGWFT